MARIFIDGFETGDASLWTEASNPDTVSSVGAMTGDYGVAMTLLAAATFIKDFPSVTDCYFAFSVNPNEIGCSTLCAIGNTSGPVFSISRSGDAVGQVFLRQGDDKGVILATGSEFKGVPSGKRSFMVFHVKVGEEGVGEITLSRNGRVLISEIGIDTTGALGGVINRVILGSSSGTVTSAGSFDDVVVDNAEAPIRPRIFPLAVVSNGSTNDFVRSEGASNADCVKEIPGDDDSFVVTDTVGANELYSIADLPPIFNNVRCAQLCAKLWYEGDATARNIKLVAKTTGGEALSSTIALTGYPEGYSLLVQLNPDTGVEFTESELNALQIGVRTVV